MSDKKVEQQLVLCQADLERMQVRQVERDERREKAKEGKNRRCTVSRVCVGARTIMTLSGHR